MTGALSFAAQAFEEQFYDEIVLSSKEDLVDLLARVSSVSPSAELFVKQYFLKQLTTAEGLTSVLRKTRELLLEEKRADVIDQYYDQYVQRHFQFILDLIKKARESTGKAVVFVAFQPHGDLLQSALSLKQAGYDTFLVSLAPAGQSCPDLSAYFVEAVHTARNRSAFKALIQAVAPSVVVAFCDQTSSICVGAALTSRNEACKVVLEMPRPNSDVLARVDDELQAFGELVFQRALGLVDGILVADKDHQYFIQQFVQDGVVVYDPDLTTQGWQDLLFKVTQTKGIKDRSRRFVDHLTTEDGYQLLRRLREKRFGQTDVGRIGIHFEAGDLLSLIHQHVMAGAIVQHFPLAKAYGIFQDDLESQLLADCNLWLHQRFPCSSSSPVLLDWFDGGQYSSVLIPFPDWNFRHFNAPDILLNPHQLSQDLSCVEMLDNIGRIFQLPKELVAFDLGHNDFVCVDFSRTQKNVQGDLAAELSMAESWEACALRCKDLTKLEMYFVILDRAKAYVGDDVIRAALANALGKPAFLVSCDLTVQRHLFRVDSVVCSARHFTTKLLGQWFATLGQTCLSMPQPKPLKTLEFPIAQRVASRVRVIAGN